MGADFKDRARKSFEKCWDLAAVEAGTPHLFRVPTNHIATSFEAEPIGEIGLIVGASVVVRIENGRVVGRQGISQVLTIATPTVALNLAVTKGCNVAHAEVISVDPISGVYEVTLR